MKNILYSFLVLAFLSCHSKSNETATSEENKDNTIVSLTDAQAKNTAIKIGKLEQKTLSSLLKVTGKIDVPPQNMVSISMPLGGYLKSTKLLPGLHISKGEVIATMEDQQYVQLQQDYLITKSRLYYAEKEFERQKELNKNQASSDKVFQMADAEYQNLRITLGGLGEKLKLININPATLSEKNISKSVALYAPINGFVSKVNVNIGKYVNPSDVLFELINPSDIHLNLKVFEKDITKLSIGQKLVAYTNNQPEKKHPCEILLISKDLSTEEHAADVHCHFENYDNSLLPGMYMNAEIELKNNNAFAINQEAIVNYEGKDYIFVTIGKNQFKMIEVKTNVAENGYVEIVNANELEGASIVTKGAYTLLMKLKNKADE
ncbi:efflux RND transporter periplasmic adaptor subunit [Flavobacterium aciduliphilum]|uniref:Cobalt-zinc-cadmium efflux system membrane fusion protein n=1 Tax=Flavobacterium aciduliphilum TaxID=1101402 RepID=A0A328YCD4_9FLAO|nr:efflux RND transporter periplasmic adaptor subunit [Flavobacterium aciduliphilum]RAR70195.1 cobalt-zinc-cadmium efflux system membrane fusion protein [Flavobacterium aciduliphilum]